MGYVKTALVFIAGCVVIGIVTGLLGLSADASAIFGLIAGMPWGWCVARIAMDRGWLPI